jgi:hypothetical protein
MSLAWYIVLEGRIPAFDSAVNGKALARAGDALDALAESVGDQPLMEFFSMSAEEFSAFADAEGLTAEHLPHGQWFFAADGLRTIDALTQAAEHGAFDQRVLADLKEFGRVLEVAQNHGVRWHLAVDI